MMMGRSWIKFVIVVFLFSSLSDCELKLWGPGLDPVNFKLPANYFFISTKEETTKIQNIQVNIRGGGDSNCRIRTETLDRNDGLFIVRYKVYFECPSFVIHITLNGELIHDPIYISGPIYPSYCNCPVDSVGAWLENNSCPSEMPQQMAADLERFKEGVIFSPALKKAEASYNNPGAFAWCHYIVKDGEFYRRCYGEHVGFNMFMDAILKYILRQVKLPDLQFMANLGDWPLVSARYNGLPMFSWCGSKNTQDIIFPTYELTESSLEMLGRQSLDVLAAMAKNAPRWEDKENKLFWKGRDSRRERLNLVKLSHKNPELINASITNFFFFRQEMAEYGGGSKSIPFFQFFDYKYQLNIDGTVAAYRFPYLLSGNSLVLKQDSEYYEHFYTDLKPWIHYVPVNADLSNLVERIEWAKQHDKEAQQIVRNAQEYVLQNLLPHHIFCYHVKLLNEWSKLLKDEIKILDGMEKISLEEKGTPKCSCQSNNSKDEL